MPSCTSAFAQRYHAPGGRRRRSCLLRCRGIGRRRGRLWGRSEGEGRGRRRDEEWSESRAWRRSRLVWRRGSRSKVFGRAWLLFRCTRSAPAREMIWSEGGDSPRCRLLGVGVQISLILLTLSSILCGSSLSYALMISCCPSRVRSAGKKSRLMMSLSCWTYSSSCIAVGQQQSGGRGSEQSYREDLLLEQRELGFGGGDEGLRGGVALGRGGGASCTPFGVGWRVVRGSRGRCYRSSRVGIVIPAHRQ